MLKTHAGGTFVMIKQAQKTVAVVHSDGAVRVTLRSLLRAHGCSVVILSSCQEFLEDSSPLVPDLILLDRLLLPQESLPMLSRLSSKWSETPLVFLPEDLGLSREVSRSLSQLLGIIDRFLQMATTLELLAV